MKPFAIILMLLFTAHAHSAPGTADGTLHFIGVMAPEGPGWKVKKGPDTLQAVLARAELAEEFLKFRPGDEALIEAKLAYEKKEVDGKVDYVPYLLVTAVSPVSLKRLGETDFEVPPRGVMPKIEFYPYTPMGLPVSPEVATSLELTGLGFMLGSMADSSAALTPSLAPSAVIFSGLLITGGLLLEEATKRISQ